MYEDLTPPPSVRRPVGKPTTEGTTSADPSALVEGAPVRLSLCMIVRDSARTLPACLQSIRPWVDEMVIVDTGSVDNTPEIVESFGGRLFHFPWCDDFAAARNESLAPARGHWLFWMDSDDTITPACGRALRELANQEIDPTILGFVMQVHCHRQRPDGITEVAAVDHVKLFRNRPDFRFEGRIHEQILPAIHRAGGQVARTNLFVVHSGSDQSPAGRERKRVRDLRILEVELQEKPEHTFTLFNIGLTQADGGDFAGAASYLKRSVAAAQPGENHLPKALGLLASCQLELGRLEDADATCRQAHTLFPTNPMLRFQQGIVFHSLGKLEDAASAFTDVLESQDAPDPSVEDRGIRGFKARQNLAVVYTDLGDFPNAEFHWRKLIEEVPAHRQAWLELGEVLIQQRKFIDVRAHLTAMEQYPLQAERLHLQRRLAEASAR